VSRTFRELWNNLLGDIPALDQFRAQDFINYAWRDIREARRWSFLSAESSLDFPDQITAGTVSVTQFSDVIFADATAKTAWDAVTLNIPLTDRQFRVGTGPLYQVIAYDSIGDASANSWNTGVIAGAAQLERTYKEDTDADETYTIYKAYHSPPSADFLSFTSVKDIQNGRNLILDLTREDLNRRDPMRESFGNPDYVAVHQADSSGEIKVELWPHLLTAKSLVCEYERAGVDFTDADSLPSIIPESLLMERALWYGCRWANDNRNRYDTLKGINWAVNIAAHELAYKEAIEKTKIVDEEGSPSNISYSPDRHVFRGFGDTSFGQSHDDGLIHY